MIRRVVEEIQAAFLKEANSLRAAKDACVAVVVAIVKEEQAVPVQRSLKGNTQHV